MCSRCAFIRVVCVSIVCAAYTESRQSIQGLLVECVCLCSSLKAEPSGILRHGELTEYCQTSAAGIDDASAGI